MTGGQTEASGASTADTNPPKDMAAITTILNPAYKNGDQLLVFSNNDNGNLHFNQRLPNDYDAKGAQVYKTLVTNPPGNIRNPSALVALYYDDYVNVYGWSKDLNLYRFSPAVTPVGADGTAVTTPSTVGALAGMNTLSGNTAYLYYLVSNPGTETTVREWRLGKNAGYNPNFQNLVVSPSTYLAAAGYAAGTVVVRYVLYQQYSDSTQDKHPLGLIKAEQTDLPVKGSDAAKEQTPLAMVAVKIDETKEDYTFFIYYVNEQNNLCRIPFHEKTQDFGTAKVYDADSDEAVAAYSQLAVTAVPSEKCNILTWVVEPTDGHPPYFRQWRNNWMEESHQPVRPEESHLPVRPVESHQPIRPVESRQPVRPEQSHPPVRPEESHQPVRPEELHQPVRPEELHHPVRPEGFHRSVRLEGSHIAARPEEEP